jgi:hypothetical protein
MIRRLFTARNKFQVFVILQLIDRDKRMSGDGGVVHHHSASIEADEAAVLSVIEIGGSEFDLSLVPMEMHAISLADLLAGRVTEWLRHDSPANYKAKKMAPGSRDSHKWH